MPSFTDALLFKLCFILSSVADVKEFFHVRLVLGVEMATPIIATHPCQMLRKSRKHCSPSAVRHLVQAVHDV